MFSESVKSKNYDEIKNIVNKFSEILSPKKVILFGSYANGNFNDESDYDFYIIMPNGYDNLNDISAKAYGCLRGIRTRPVDILVDTEDSFERLSNRKTIERTVKKDGIILYEKRG